MNSLKSRLHPGDLFRVAVVGLRLRRLRSVLSAVGIAIGIGALVAVLGLSDSSKSDLLSSLDRLGTNLLVVQPSTGIGLGPGTLPEEAPVMVGRIGPVDAVAAVATLDANVYRSDLIPEGRTGGIAVAAADEQLIDTLGADLAAGVYLDRAAADYPTVALGAVAADRLGFVRPGGNVWLGGQWFAVVGILEPIELAADLDRTVFVGWNAATGYLDADPTPTSIYVRTSPQRVEDVRGVIPATANPENPDQVEVERPSDVLEARAAAESAFTGLFLGLGAVALLVGGVGIANVMVISVLERRSEIGLRRALGATTRHIAWQFLAESLTLAALGGLLGVGLGVGVTAAVAAAQGWDLIIPPLAIWGGAGAALGIGALAGMYPALRAAHLSPTEALRAG